MIRLVTQLWSAWDKFWFGERSLLNLAIFRIVLCLTLGVLYLTRSRDVVLYFTDQGILPRALALDVYVDFSRPPFLLTFWADSWTVAVHWVLVVGTFALALGLGGRVVNALVWFLHLAFLQRNYAIAFGADLIGGLLLFLMIGTQSCARLSVWNWFREKKLGRTPELPVRSDMATGAFYRLLQFQLMAVYAWTGWEKLKGASWWDGTALWTVLANPQLAVFEMGWLRHFPLIVAVLTTVTWIFEIYFPVLVWNPRIRPWLLGFGVCFHLGIGALMALWGFAFVMISPYILFLSEDWFQRLKMRQNPRLSSILTIFSRY